LRAARDDDFLPEEIALHLGYIDQEQLRLQAQRLSGNQYAQYLLRLLEASCHLIAVTMRILLIGKYGQLVGAPAYTGASGEILALDYPEIDLAKPSLYTRLCRRFTPRLSSCAAYTAVDRAESEEELAMAITGAPRFAGDVGAPDRGGFCSLFDGLRL